MRAVMVMAAALLAVAVAGCGVREAEMRLPAGLAQQTTKLELRGMGGWQTGTFELDGASGSFTRRADRLAFFDPLIVKSYGGSSFTVKGAGFAGELSAQCGFRQVESSAGVVKVTPLRLVYRCSFRRDGQPIAAELELRDRYGLTGSLESLEEREGFLSFEGRRIGIRSVHRTTVSPLHLATPVGFAFDVDGRAVGAIDTSGLDKTLFVPVQPELREAVLAASLALAVFWDPATISAR